MRTLVRLMRHAEAEDPVNESFEADLARSVSRKGFLQIDARVAEMGQNNYHLVISGESVRTRETVGYAADCEDAKVNIFPALTYHDPRTMEGAACDSLYRKFGDMPLLRYITAPNGWHIMARSSIAWDAITPTIFSFARPCGQDGVRRVLVGVHGYYGTALAIAAICKSYPGDYATTQMIATHPLAKAGVIDLCFSELDVFEYAFIRPDLRS